MRHCAKTLTRDTCSAGTLSLTASPFFALSITTPIANVVGEAFSFHKERGTSLPFWRPRRKRRCSVSLSSSATSARVFDCTSGTRMPIPCKAWTSRTYDRFVWAAKRQLTAGLLEGTAITGKGVVRRSDSSLSIGGVDGMDACTEEPRACGRAWVHCRCYVHSLALVPWCPGHTSAELWGWWCVSRDAAWRALGDMRK